MIDLEYDIINNIKVDVLKAYVGKNASNYIAKWEKIYLEQKCIQIYWIPLFFPFFWFGYRKMNHYYALYLSSYFIFELTPVFRNSLYFKVMFLVILSALSYILYFLKIENTISYLTTLNLTEDEYLEQLKRKGGVICILITMVWIFIKLYLKNYTHYYQSLDSFWNQLLNSESMKK